MADGHAALAAQIARLRAMKTLARDAAPKVAAAVELELKQQVAKGVGPDGKPWALTQRGERPLKGAAQSLTVRAIGNIVLARIEGIHARHHLGAVRGGVKRQILPTAKIPDPVTKAIGDVVTSEFRRTMGGG